MTLVLESSVHLSTQSKIYPLGVGENVLHRLVERGEGAEAGEDLPGTGQFISVENKTVYQTGY